MRKRERLDPPRFLPNVHYQLMLNLDPTMVGKLVAGATLTHGPMGVLHFTMPNHVALPTTPLEFAPERTIDVDFRM